MTESPSLCPFCGTESFTERVQEPRLGFAVKCHNCGAHGPVFVLDPEAMNHRGTTWELATAPLRKKAVEAWNTRFDFVNLVSVK